MKRFFRIIMWMLGLLTSFFFLIILGSKQLDNRDTFEVTSERFKHINILLEEHVYSTGTGKVYYVTAGKPSSKTLLFIHGSPGDWTAWEQLLLESSLVENYRIVIVDRPHYQASTALGGSLSKQSHSLRKMMELECHPCTLVGHSYGGALALQLAVDFPEYTSAVVSLAGTVASSFQLPKWYNLFAQMSWVLPFLSEGLKMSNKEMLSLPQDLNSLVKPLTQLDIPIYFLQGGNDVLVDPRSPFVLLPYLNHSEIKYDSSWDHFVIWTSIPEVELLIDRVNL